MVLEIFSAAAIAAKRIEAKESKAAAPHRPPTSKETPKAHTRDVA